MQMLITVCFVVGIFALLAGWLAAFLMIKDPKFGDLGRTGSTSDQLETHGSDKAARPAKETQLI